VTEALNIHCEASGVCDRGKGWHVKIFVQFPVELASQGSLEESINSFDFEIT